MNTSFGEFIKQKRLEQNLSLRKFCELAEVDPSNWSKIERGLIFPPEREKIKQIANVLNLEENSTEWCTLFDYASIARKRIPEYVYSNEKVIAALPIFFRTASGNKPTEEELNQIIKLLEGR